MWNLFNKGIRLIYLQRWLFVEEQLDKLEYCKSLSFFYFFINVPDYYEDNVQFTIELAQQTKVGLVPSRFFRFSDYIRISFVTDMATLDRNMKQIAAHILPYVPIT